MSDSTTTSPITEESNGSPSVSAPETPAPDVHAPEATVPESSGAEATAPDVHAPEASGAETEAERMQRAEAKVDELGERTGRFVAEAGHAVLRMAARAREEAEDMLAEAQSIRRGQNQP